MIGGSRSRRRVRPAGLLLLATISAAALLGGCAKGPLMNDQAPGSAPDERPVLGEAVATYDVMLEEMKLAVSDAVPGGTWTASEAATTSVGDESVAGDGAIVGRSALWIYDRPLPSASGERSALIDRLGQIGESHGFTAVAVYIDRPAQVKAVAYDAFGAEYHVGSGVQATLRYTTGSHPAG
jgi:hypothetical protein